MRPLEPDPAAVERLAVGADPKLLAEAARVTAPSEQEVAVLLGALRRERVPTRRGWPVWVGGALLAGGMAFAGLRAVEAPAPVAPAASVSPVVSPVVAEVRTPPPVIAPAPAPAPDVVTLNRGSPPRSPPAEPSQAARVEAAPPPEPPIPPPPPAPAPEESKEPRIFAALLAREEAGEAPGRLLPDVEAFAQHARSAHLRAEAELLALELQARAGASDELADRAHTWAGEHLEHPRVGTAWLIAGDAAMKARDCQAAREAWAAAATSTEREVAERARSRKCR